jgi:hypothetical protein
MPSGLSGEEGGGFNYLTYLENPRRKIVPKDSQKIPGFPMDTSHHEHRERILKWAGAMAVNGVFAGCFFKIVDRFRFPADMCLGGEVL